LLKTETLDENLERLRGNLPPMNPAASNAVSQTGSFPAPPSGPAPAPANEANNTPATLGGFETAYLETKQQLIFAKYRQEILLGQKLGTNAPAMQELDKVVSELEMKLAICKQQSQEQLASRQHTLELQIATLQDQIKVGEKDALDVSKKLSDYEALKEKHTRLQTLYDQMQANLQTLDVNKGIGQESVSILEPATPASPVPPDTQKHLLMAGLIGGVLGFGVLLFISLLNDRPSSFSELEALFDLPILGQIPKVKSKNKKTPPVLQVDDGRYPLIESYRSLRSAFLYKDALKGGVLNPPKTIVIASGYPEEGKSTTSANFAITLAQAGARVLLIDADLHRGVLHECFAAAESPGLAEVFAGKCAWNSAVQTTPFPNLYLLPRGIAPRQSGNLFAKSSQFLAESAGFYDYYIFDSAPVMMADDVLSLAPHADALMLVVRAGFTSGRIAKAALDLLRQRRVNIVGLVFNAVPASTGDYYSYRAKDYYLHHSPAK
jgi:capsular exopolysaccharide synthesis family protein